MARVELPDELVLPTPRDAFERELFNALAVAYRNVVVALASLAKAPNQLFVQTANQSVGSSASETTLIGTGTGSVNIDSKLLTEGKSLRIRGSGYYSAGASETLRLKVKFDSTTILDTTAQSFSSAVTNQLWDIEALITTRSVGSSGTIQAQGKAIFNIPNTSTSTIDTTQEQTVDITAQWGSASTLNNITLTNLFIEELN